LFQENLDTGQINHLSNELKLGADDLLTPTNHPTIRPSSVARLII